MTVGREELRERARRSPVCLEPDGRGVAEGAVASDPAGEVRCQASRPVVTERLGRGDFSALDAAREAGVYRALDAALEGGPESVLETVEAYLLITGRVLSSGLRRCGLWIGCAALVSGVLAAGAQERAPAPAGAGRSLYASYCAGCHGVDGRGGGPDAADLMVKPPDLTRLHERYGSPLRADEVAAFIDGRADVRAHGPREMPVWGERFFAGDPGPPQGVASARRRTIELLVEHLQRLQGQEEVRRPGAPAAEPRQSAQAIQSDA